MADFDEENEPSIIFSTLPFTVNNIELKLKTDKTKFIIIEGGAKSSSPVWAVFGIPAQINHLGQYEPIKGFSSCKKCNKTYKYSSKVGTNPMKGHKCFKLEEILKKSKSSASSNVTGPLDQMGVTIQKQIERRDVEKMKDLVVNWIAGSMRPISIVDDYGFRQIVQQAILMGKQKTAIFSLSTHTIFVHFILIYLKVPNTKMYRWILF